MPVRSSAALTRRRLSALALGSAAALSRPSMAQQRMPDGPVTMVVPYTPGTGPDILARLVTPVLGQRLGQPVVVDNRAGASGNIGSQAVARAAPDGRTLMMQVNTFVMNPSLFKQVPYDPVGNFAPIVKLTTGDLVLVVNPDVRADGPKASPTSPARSPAASITRRRATARPTTSPWSCSG